MIEKADWGHDVRACWGKEQGDCQDNRHFCAPSAAAAAAEPSHTEWKECLLVEGAYSDSKCPNGWDEHHWIYEDPTITDTRGCSECTCGAPVGSKCSASVSVYTDDCCGCTQPGAPTLLTLGVESTGPACGSVVSGSALGSKEATMFGYQPGSCVASDRGPIGDTTGDDTILHNKHTVCCKQSLVPR